MSSRATFALGCFWCPEAQFGLLRGVLKTRVGYAGGTRPSSPSYKNLGDHSECVQIDFDPQCLSYRQLLDAFWSWHDPISQYGSGQYASAIFYQTDEQRREAEESKGERERVCRRALPTRIDRLNTFTRAEEYHQKVDPFHFSLCSALAVLLQHYLKRHAQLSTLELDEVQSSRLNGYLAGYGTREQFAEETFLKSLSAENGVKDFFSSHS